MKRIEKKYIISIIIAILTVSSVQLSIGYSGDVNANPTEVLTFLGDVVKLDMTKYNAKLVTGPITDHPSALGGLTEVTGKYTLSSETSTIDVLFVFTNGTLSWCLMRVMSGLPQYSQNLTVDIPSKTEDFLQSYQFFTGDSSLEAMQNILKITDASKNSTTLYSNLKLEVSVTSSYHLFKWSNTHNNAIFSSLSVVFKNANFYSFGDDRCYVKIGNTDVNLLEEGAVSLALDCAKQYSYTYAGKEVSNFTILNDSINVELLTKAKDVPLVLYPYWMVKLPLGELYPGFVTMLVVEIWADTVEVASVYPLGIGGGTIPFDGPAFTPESSTSPSPSPTIPEYPTWIILPFTIVIALMATMIVRRKKQKQP